MLQYIVIANLAFWFGVTVASGIVGTGAYVWHRWGHKVAA